MPLQAGRHANPFSMVGKPLPTSFNAGMSLQALMALLGHVSTEMTLRYAALAAPAVRTGLRRSDEQGPHPADPGHRPGRPAHHPRPGRMAAGRDAQDPSRARLLLPPARRRSLPLRQHLRAGDNYVTAPEFIPQLEAQLADVTALRDDATARGWHTEVARHSHVIASIQRHLQQLQLTARTGHNA